VGGGEAALRVRVISGFGVEGFTEHELGSRKARTALRLLAIASGRSVSAERIADVLWADNQPLDPAGQLAVIMSRLRGVLGSERITHGDHGYTLRVDWLDLTAATDLVAEAERRLAAGNPAAALSAALSARELLAQPQLDDDVWLEQERRSMTRLTARSRHLVSRIALAAGDVATGVEAAEQALDADPYDEDALRLAMAGLAAQGRTSSALALHEAIRAQLAEELGTSPSDETDAAHRAVLKGLPVPGIDVAVHTGRGTGGASDSIVGREEELRTLDSLFATVADGAPRVVVIEGEPGIGKSALAAAWIGSLSPDTRVFETRCDQVSRVLPLQPALQMLQEFLRRAGSADALALLGTDAGMLEPVLNWQGGTAPNPDTAQMLVSSPAGIAVIFAALGRVVARASASRSVLFIDDIQRADPMTWDWIAGLARTGGLPLLILLTRRSDEGLVPAASSVIHLTPLAVDTVALLVGTDRAAELHRRSGGNPLFLTALARADPGSDLPESVHAAVVARCAEAGPDAGPIRDAAVLGTRIDVDVLARVLKMEPIPLLSQLETGIRLQLLDERDGSYVFRHEIVREALEASVGSPRRALLHRNAARVLTTQPGVDPMLIAHHARLSGAQHLAAEALTTASRIAMDRFDYATAVTLADEAITASNTTAARMQRATVLLRLARYDDARVDAEVAVARGDDVRAYEVAGAIAFYCRDFRRAAALGKALLESATTPTQRVQGYIIQARAMHAEGQVREGYAQLGAALEICSAQGIRRPASVDAWFKVHMGEPEAAMLALESSPAGPNEFLSTIYTPVHASFIYGYALATCGRAGDALRTLDRAYDETRRWSLARYEPLAANMRSWVFRNIGAIARAREGNQIAEDGARAVGYRELEVYATLDPCDDDLATGDVATATTRLVVARELMQTPYAYSWRHRLRVRLLEGRIALLGGMPEAALEQAIHLIEDASHCSAPRYVRLGQALSMRARAEMGDEPPDEASLEALSEALATVAGVEAWWLLAELGAALESPRCFELAAVHRDRLAASLDADDRVSFADYAGARLERIRTRGASPRLR
jgi:DNA-binding SARP family transcriptional activator